MQGYTDESVKPHLQIYGAGPHLLSQFKQISKSLPKELASKIEVAICNVNETDQQKKVEEVFNKYSQQDKILDCDRWKNRNVQILCASNNETSNQKFSKFIMISVEIIDQIM